MGPEYEIPNPDVKAHADQFADAALFLFEHMTKINCVPSVLLESALAIELYLKSLSSRTVYHSVSEDPQFGYRLTAKPTKRDHRLQELFAEIHPEIRDELEQAYTANPMIEGVSRLIDALNDYDNLFVETRHVFERNAGTGKSISNLIHLLKWLRTHVSCMPLRYAFANEPAGPSPAAR
jgi:hypothetical protein